MSSAILRNLWLIPVLVVLAMSVPAPAQTTQPAQEPASGTAPPAREPYDPWTSKTMTGDWGGLRRELEDLGLKLTLSYQHQLQHNWHGGLETKNGHAQTGTYDLILRLDFEKMGLIDNAGFYFKTKGSFGDGINGEKVGALNKINSDANGDHPIFVKKWWYWQKFLDGRIELRLGNLETNKDLFDVSLYANHEDKDFLNRLSIRNATIPHRTGIGAFLKAEPVDGWYIQAAAVDRQSRARRTGFDTAFHNEAWFLGMWETGFTPKWESPKGPMPGRYRAGFWYDPKSKSIFENDLDGRRRTHHRGDDVGFYFGFDQMIWKENRDPKDTQGLGLFARYGWSHDDVNKMDQYWQTGLSYKGLVPTRDRDVAGFTVSQAMLSKQYRNEIHERADRETVYEWYYKLYLTPWFIISPDLQVITNPGGDKDDRNAVVGGIRIRVIF